MDDGPKNGQINEKQIQSSRDDNKESVCDTTNRVKINVNEISERRQGYETGTGFQKEDANTRRTFTVTVVEKKPSAGSVPNKECQESTEEQNQSSRDDNKEVVCDATNLVESDANETHELKQGCETGTESQKEDTATSRASKTPDVGTVPNEEHQEPAEGQKSKLVSKLSNDYFVGIVLHIVICIVLLLLLRIFTCIDSCIVIYVNSCTPISNSIQGAVSNVSLSLANIICVASIVLILWIVYSLRFVSQWKRYRDVFDSIRGIETFKGIKTCEDIDSFWGSYGGLGPTEKKELKGKVNKHRKKLGRTQIPISAMTMCVPMILSVLPQGMTQSPTLMIVLFLILIMLLVICLKRAFVQWVTCDELYDEMLDYDDSKKTKKRIVLICVRL